jgi:hypothetical protein
MTVSRNKLQLQRIGSSNYPYIEMSLTQADSVDGMILEVEAFAILAAPVTVSIVGLLRDEDSVILEVAGNTHYSINAAAAASRKIGDWTFDFSAQKVNRVFFKAGTTVGGVAFPAVLPPRLGLLFTNVDLQLKSASASKRINRMEG